MIKKAILRLMANTRAGTMFIPKSFLFHYLNEIGWYESHITGKPLDKDKCPLPWLTYAAIAFLEERLQKEMQIFEYGSGNSTLWWSKRVFKVVSCEHNNEWYRQIKPMIPSNVEYIYIDLAPGGDYSKKILNYNEQFDIVVIDGRERVNCAKNSLDALKYNGVIVWDNSNREKYADGYDFLKNEGFKRLDFSGLGPIGVRGWRTSIFYRTDNCLGI